MILVNPRLDITIKKIKTDDIGRIIIADVTIQDTPFNIVNIYSPNSEGNQVHFFNQLNNILKKNIFSGENTLVGGDFNTVLDAEKDRKSDAPVAYSQSCRRIIGTLNLIKERFELEVIWRLKNPDKRKYTWSRKNPSKVKSRLDYLLSSEHLSDSIDNADIMPCIKSDHSAITLNMNSSQNNLPRIGRGYWKLNTSFLNDQLYVEGITNNLRSWLEDVNVCDNDTIKWEFIRFKIRQFSMDYGKDKTKKLVHEEQEIENKLYDLEEKVDEEEVDQQESAEAEVELQNIRARLGEISNYKTEGLILRSQATWYEQGEKSTKYFLRLGSRNRIKKSMNKLQREDGTFTTNPEEILNMQRDCYADLYSAKCSRSEDEIT